MEFCDSDCVTIRVHECYTFNVIMMSHVHMLSVLMNISLVERIIFTLHTKKKNKRKHKN